MPAITVNVAVLYNNQILLTKRDDFEVWCLPSGGVEDGESLAQAAMRETKEETGTDIELVSLVGVYSRIGALPDVHAVLFTATPIGASLQTQPGETIEVRYFPLDQIPDNLSFGHRKRIEDAIGGVGSGIAVTQELTLPLGQKITSHALAETRKLDRETRVEFYRQMMKQATLRVKTDIGPEQ